LFSFFFLDKSINLFFVYNKLLSKASFYQQLFSFFSHFNEKKALF